MNNCVSKSVDPQKETEADKIEVNWYRREYKPSEAEVKTAAQLAQEGYLSSVKYMTIVGRDISEISSDSMKKLASIVSDEVFIYNINNSTQLGAILASVQSRALNLHVTSLSEENTQALVTAMSRVPKVLLWGVTLDPELLSAYDGQGSCNLLVMGGYMRAKYGDRLKRWAADRGWTVTADDDFLRVQRLINFWFYLQLRT